MPTNDFLEFCATDTGTNLDTQSEYAAASDRTSGQKPGVARSKLNNKGLRQANYIASQLAQHIANQTGTDVLDDATPTKLLAQIQATIQPLVPEVTKYTSGSGNHDLSYNFFLSTASACTVGATYTNNAVTYTVKRTIAAAKLVVMTGASAPTVSGTLTKASGTGDSSIVFRAYRAPLTLAVKMVGAGGGGGGSGTASGGTGGTGGTTTFGTTLLSAAGGVGGGYNTQNGGAGGAASLGTGPFGIALSGGYGGSPTPSGQLDGTNFTALGGNGGASAFGGQGSNANTNAGKGGTAGVTNTGGGGGGASNNISSGGGNAAGAGGGAGAYVDAVINSPSGQYPYAVGAAGTAGSAGTSGAAGSVGGSGIILVTEYFQ